MAATWLPSGTAPLSAKAARPSVTGLIPTRVALDPSHPLMGPFALQ